jgi:hypothetical protein
LSEAEIVEQLFSMFDRYWVIVQWWASVSFGLIMVAHFASDKIGPFLLVTVIGLYGIYSLWVFFLLGYNIAIGMGMLEDLDSLSSAGLLKSQGARVVLEHPFATYGTWVGMFALPATFFSCIGYLIYAFFHARKST